MSTDTEQKLNESQFSDGDNHLIADAISNLAGDVAYFSTLGVKCRIGINGGHKTAEVYIEHPSYDATKRGGERPEPVYEFRIWFGGGHPVNLTAEQTLNLIDEINTEFLAACGRYLEIVAGEDAA